MLKALKLIVTAQHLEFLGMSVVGLACRYRSPAMVVTKKVSALLKVFSNYERLSASTKAQIT